MPEIKDLYFPKRYGDIKKIRVKYNKNKFILVSLERFKDPAEAKRLKDFLLGMTVAKRGFVFQYKKLMLFSQIKDFGTDDTFKLSRFTWRDGKRR